MSDKITAEPLAFDEWLEQYQQFKENDLKDLSADQDLTIAIMNLLGIEEHLFFSGAKTEKNAYFDLIYEVRELRKTLLAKLIKEPDGEEWCLSKHLLAASYRLMEVGTKKLADEDKETAYTYFKQAYQLYTLFWGIAFHLVVPKDIELEKIEKPSEIEIKQRLEEKASLNNGTFWQRLQQLVKKAVNCCRE